MHTKVDALIFYKKIYILKNAVLGVFFMFGFLMLFSPYFLVTMQNVWEENEFNKHWIGNSLPRSLDVRIERSSFALLTAKPIAPHSAWCRLGNKPFGEVLVGGGRGGTHGRGTLCMVTLTFLSWCKRKWSWVEFNGQLHILEDQGTTSWSMM